jgi:hypothetical protein
VIARLRSEAGQASAELLGMLPYLLLAIMLVWQGLLAAWAYTQASNAARTASRVHGRSDDADPRKAARNALSPPLRRNMGFRMEGDRATVKVRIPILVPGLDAEDLVAKRSAELPS